MAPLYQLTTTRPRGQSLSMADYAGRVVLVVSTTSHCGFTPQYAGLETLYKRYAAQRLVVSDFPRNRFGKWESGGADEVEQTCHVSYGVSFPMLGEVDVNGPATYPLFRYLKRALPGVSGGRIKWNFTRLLITRGSIPFTHSVPLTTLEKMEASIVVILTR